MAASKSISGSVTIKNIEIDGDIAGKENKKLQGTVPGDLELTAPDPAYAYSGPYEVKPSLEEQMLETAGLMMEENITIEEIPIYVVSNNSGGTTVTIGG